jgi:hypothetical protein
MGFLSSVLRVGVLVLSVCVVGAAPAEEPAPETNVVIEESELKIYEAAVTLKLAVQCRKYEGRILNCTTEVPGDLSERLETKLMLGVAGVRIGERDYDVEPLAGATVKFHARGKDREVDVSGIQDVRLRVVFVK